MFRAEVFWWWEPAVDGMVRGDQKALAAGMVDVERTAGDVMTTSPKTIAPSALAVQALHIMEAQRITSLAVVDDDQRVQGVVHLHDLWRTELF